MESYNLPIKLRSWFAHKVSKQIERANDARAGKESL